MNILIFGASGKVGSLVVGEALRRGHTVTAFVHKKELAPRDGLTSVRGDIYNNSSVATAIAGHDAIICALGSWGTRRKDVVSTAMLSIVPASEKAGVRRLVSVTGDGARAPGDNVTLFAQLTRPLLMLMLPKILKDGEAHIATLSQSSLNWTVVRSPVMTGSSAADYSLHRRSASLKIPRAAVVQAMVDLVDTDEWVRAAPFIRRE